MVGKIRGIGKYSVGAMRVVPQLHKAMAAANERTKRFVLEIFNWTL